MKWNGSRGRALVALAVASSFLVACNRGDKIGPKPISSAAPPETKKIRLEPRPARVGDKARVGRTTEMKMSVEFWQEGEKFGSQESSRTEDYVRDVEVLALVGGVPSKERARYERYRFKEAKPDEPLNEDNALEGQTYVVDGSERETKATFADGKPVAKEELERLDRLHADLAVEDKIIAELKGLTIDVGSHAGLREALFRALVTTAPGNFKSGTITLTATRTEGGRETALFDWSAEMSTEEDNGMETTWHIKGNLVLGLSPAQTLRAAMSADIDVGGHTRRDGKRIDIEGSGSIKDERTFTPL